MSGDERLDVRVVRDFGFSRRKAKETIDAGQVDVDGVRVRDAGHRVSLTQNVIYEPNRRREASIRFSLPVVHQDEHLVVVDKPPGLLSVPTDGGVNDDCVLNRLRADLARVRGFGPTSAPCTASIAEHQGSWPWLSHANATPRGEPRFGTMHS